MSEDCTPIFFNLVCIDNEGCSSPKEFPVPTIRGKTLFEALTEYEKRRNNFSFETRDARHVGHYVVDVMKKKNEPKKCWIILLNNQNDDIVPINLDYKVNDGDKVFLRYTSISSDPKGCK